MNAEQVAFAKSWDGAHDERYFDRLRGLGGREEPPLFDTQPHEPEVPPSHKPAIPAASDADAEPARPDFQSAASIALPIDVGAWNVEGVNRPASLLIIGGGEGIAKTQMFRELAIRAATATGHLFGHYDIPRRLRVMILDEENGEAEEYRRETAILEALGLERADLTDYFRVSFAGMVLTDATSQRWLDGQVERIRPEILILDTGTSMVGEEWGTELKTAVRYIRSVIRRYGCSVAVAVHMVKPSRDRRPNAAAHGTSMADVMGQWTRSADSVALIADLGAGRLRWEMRKKVPPSTLILAKRDGVFDVVSVGEPPKPTTDDRALRAIAAGATTADEIVTALVVSARTVTNVIGRLRKDGLIGPDYPYRLTDDGRERWTDGVRNERMRRCCVGRALGVRSREKRSALPSSAANASPIGVRCAVRCVEVLPPGRALEPHKQPHEYRSSKADISDISTVIGMVTVLSVRGRVRCSRSVAKFARSQTHPHRHRNRANNARSAVGGLLASALASRRS